MIFLLFVSLTLWVIWRAYSFFLYRRRSYDGKTVLVTGATSEVGRRLCFRFYGLNARIVAWDSSKSRLEELQRDVVSYYAGVDGPAGVDAASSAEASKTPTAAGGDNSRSSPKVAPTGGFARTTASSASGTGGGLDTKDSESFIVQSTDLGTRLTVQRLAKELLAAGIVPDVILHAAHTYPTRSFLERPDDAMEKVVLVNTLAPLWIAKVLLPAMLAKRTSCQIVQFVATGRDQCTQPIDAPDYVASQWGVVGAHYALRRWVNAQKRAWKGTESGTAGSSSASSSTAAPTSPRARLSSSAVASKASAAASQTDNVPNGNVTGPVGDVRFCLASLQAVQLTTPSIFSVPYAVERGLASEDSARTASGSHSLGSSASRRAPSVPGVQGTRGGSVGGISGTAGGSGTDSTLSPSQLASREARRLDAAVDHAIRAIVYGKERYDERQLSHWLPLFAVLPVPWYAKFTQWLDR